ncbi:protein of unknown function [Paraburkholderia dioscoreae]|uniref:Uncharacterized protein n=1 Tax=Paraburkholderia dioscoreae TaxID=2604047 RepID=A0A5Q4ZDN3_9BURK|nr:protein of unknown function [Paraburkholderia dioscoreae]
MHGAGVSAKALTPTDRNDLHGAGVSAKALTPTDRNDLHGVGVSAKALTPTDTGDRQDGIPRSCRLRREQQWRGIFGYGGD